jgi:hypothetical protein
MAVAGVAWARSDLERGAAVRFALENATVDELAGATGLPVHELRSLSRHPGEKWPPRCPSDRRRA